MENCISVSQLNKYIKNIFDSEEMLHNISVFGEIGNYTVSNNIAYFNLKDNDNLLQCVLFNANKFDTPKLGDMVLLTGSINYYAKGGKLSFNAVNLRPYGKGLLYEAFLKLKNDLEQKGYFDVSKKKAIPEHVKRIGVVTSATGAVIQDIIDVTTRRNNTIDIVLYPVKVQGVGAEVEIANGINFFSDYDKVDVVIVARGGGSLEDLQPFNTEIVANATYNCKKPIVSGVGHETDYTIIDFVADLRAPTPSAAAELVAWRKDLMLNTIYSYLNKIERANMFINNQYLNKIDKQITFMNNELLKRFTQNEVKINKNLYEIEVGLLNKINNCEHKINILSNTMQKLNPLTLLDKGYVKIFKNNKKVVSASQLNVGESITFDLLDGKVVSNVVNVDKRSLK